MPETTFHDSASLRNHDASAFPRGFVTDAFYPLFYPDFVAGPYCVTVFGPDCGSANVADDSCSCVSCADFSRPLYQDGPVCCGCSASAPDPSLPRSCYLSTDRHRIPHRSWHLPRRGWPGPDSYPRCSAPPPPPTPGRPDRPRVAEHQVAFLWVGVGAALLSEANIVQAVEAAGVAGSRRLTGHLQLDDAGLQLVIKYEDSAPTVV